MSAFITLLQTYSLLLCTNSYHCQEALKYADFQKDVIAAPVLVPDFAVLSFIQEKNPP